MIHKIDFVLPDGDTVSFNPNPAIAFRVVARHWSTTPTNDQRTLKLILELVEHPLAF